MSNIQVPPGIDRKALWVVKELGRPVIVRICVSCRSTRHRPTGKFRVNANGKLLDVWLLIGCERCGRTSKIAVHERVNVRDLANDRLVRFENNDTALVRQLNMDPGVVGRLDWSGTWELETDLPFYDLASADAAPVEVIVRFEFPAPIRLEKLLMAGLGRSRSAVRVLVGSGRIRLPRPLGAKVRDDLTLTVG